MSIGLDLILGSDYKSGEKNIIQYIDVIKTALEIIPTYFGCLFTIDEPPTEEEIVFGKIKHIYPVNYFSNELQEKYITKINHLNPEIDIIVGNGRLIIPKKYLNKKNIFIV